LVGGEGFEEAVGHEGGGELGVLGDFGGGDGFLGGEGLEGDLLFVAGADDAGEGAAVLELEDGELEIGGDDGGGGDDVFEEVVEVVSAAAGEVGADLAALAVEGVAGGAGGLEGAASGGEVGGGEGGRGEVLLELGDEGGFFGGAVVEGAPGGGEEGGEFVVVEGLDLSGVVGGEVLARKFAGGDALEEDAGEGGSGDEGFEDFLIFAGVEGAEPVEDAVGDGGVVELAETLEGDGVEEAGVEEIFAEFAEVVGLLLDKGAECAFAEVEGIVATEGEGADLAEGAAIAEEDVEGANVFFEFGVGFGEGFPGGWFGDLVGGGEGFDHAAEEVGLGFGWGGGVGLKEKVEGFGACGDVLGEATGDEAADFGQAAGGGDVGELVGVIGGEGVDAIPDHEGEVVVVGVFGVGGEGFGEGGAELVGEALEGGGEGEADEGGGVVFGECGEVGKQGFGEFGALGGVVAVAEDVVEGEGVDEEADGPDAKVFVLVGEEGGEVVGGEGVELVEGPEGVEALGSGVGGGEEFVEIGYRL